MVFARITWFIAALAVVPAALSLGCRTQRMRAAAPVPAVPHGFVAARRVSPLFDPALAPTRLDTKERDRWQQPARIVAALHLSRGQTVADIGTGSGYLLPYLSHAVGPHGSVIAEEVQEEFLPALRRRARELHNIQVTLGAIEDPKLSVRDVAAFVLLTVYHEVDRPVDFLANLRKYAAPGARLAIIDFDKSRKGSPPAPVGHEISEAAVIQEANAAGWELAARHEFIPSQFYLVFRQQRR